MESQTRFVIIAHPDNGAKHLSDMLNKHGQVKVYFDLFNRSNHEIMSTLESEGNLMKLGVDPVDYLESKIFLDVPQDNRAVGLTMSYDQAQQGSWVNLWTYARKHLKVIHLKQRNRLGTFLTPRRGHLESVIVNPFEFQRFAEITDQQEANFDTTFRHCGALEVFWEDLVNDRENEVSRIEHFIDVEVKDLSFKHRIYTGPFFGACENYQELEGHFKGTKLSEYFQ